MSSLLLLFLPSMSDVVCDSIKSMVILAVVASSSNKRCPLGGKTIDREGGFSRYTLEIFICLLLEKWSITFMLSLAACGFVESCLLSIRLHPFRSCPAFRSTTHLVSFSPAMGCHINPNVGLMNIWVSAFSMNSYLGPLVFSVVSRILSDSGRPYSIGSASSAALASQCCLIWEDR